MSGSLALDFFAAGERLTWRVVLGAVTANTTTPFQYLAEKGQVYDVVFVNGVASAGTANAWTAAK